MNLALKLGQFTDDLRDLMPPGAKANLKQDILFALSLSLLCPLLEKLANLYLALKMSLKVFVRIGSRNSYLGECFGLFIELCS